ncbi:MAG TPA: TMEM175 family protein [Candidatus Limnocylindrales bacterium]
MSGSPAADLRDRRARLRFERVVFFSDAVMAIAITLLLIDLRPPETDEAGYEAALRAMLVRPEPFIAVAIGFLVLGSYWISHRAVFSLLERAAPRVIWANLLFLFGIAIQPFFTMALSAHVPNETSVAAYSICQVGTGLSLWAVWRLAAATPGTTVPISSRRARYLEIQLLHAPAAFAASVPVTIAAGPLAGMLAWFLQVPVAVWAARKFAGLPGDPDG